MLNLNYVSAQGSAIQLTGNGMFILTNIDAQTAAATSISSNTVGGMDGETVTNIQAAPRTIVLDLRLNPRQDVEVVKRYILKFFKLKQHGSLVWTQSDRTVTISGYVEQITMPRWNNAITMQISLHCEQPFWEDVDFIIQRINEYVDIHYFTDDPFDMLYFPDDGIVLGEYDTIRTKAFDNEGDVAVGLKITVNALNVVTNPIIYDADGDFFGIGYGTAGKQITMNTGDIIEITTGKGQKSVTLNGKNIIDKVKPGSTWLQLQPGQNQFTINSDDEDIENMYFNLTYKRRYV